MNNLFDKIIKVILYSLVFFLPLFFLPFTFDAFEFNKLYLLFFLVSIGLISRLLKIILTGEIKFKKTPLNAFILIFLFLAIFSTLFSVDKTFSLFGFYGRFSNGFLSLLFFVLFFCLLSNSFKEEKEISNIVFTFLLSSFFVVLVAFFSISGLWQKLLKTTFSKGFNTIGSLESLAIFLTVVITLLVGLLLNQNSKGKKIFYSLLLAAGIFLLMCINFKSAWILLIFALTFFLIFSLTTRIFRENINKLLLPICLIIFSVIFLFFNFFNFQLPREQILPQKISWQIGLKSATENLKSGFLGSGIGTYFYDFSKFKSAEWNKSPFWLIRFDRSGNHLAEILGTMGFFAFISYIFLVGISLFFSFSLLSKKPETLPFVFAFLTLFLAQFFYYQNTVLALSFWLFLGLLTINWEKPISERVFSLKKIPEINLFFNAFLIVICVLLLVSYYFGFKFYQADIFYLKAQTASDLFQKISFLEKAISLNSNFVHYKIDLARTYLAKAFEEISKPAETQDQNTILFSIQQAINYGKGVTSDEVSIRGAIEISPNWVASWENLGLIYREIMPLVGEPALELGIKSFEQATKLEPTSPILHTELGKLYFNQGDKDKAKAEFEKAIELKEDYFDAKLQEALLLESEGNFKEAIQKMEELVVNFPLNIEARSQLGRLYFNQNKLDEAIFQFEQAILILPNHYNSLYSLGLAYEKKGDTEKALEYFEKVLELNPGNPEVIKKIEELKK